MRRTANRKRRGRKPSVQGLRASLEILRVALALKQGLPADAKRRLATRDA